MKVCLVTDPHFGIHKSSEIFSKSQLNFFDKEFIPYLKENKIRYIFILGDIFDTRNSINNKTINDVYHLFERMAEFKIFVIVGNHDTYFKNRIDIHSLKFLKKFSNITVIDENKIIELNEKRILLSPWQINYVDFLEYVNKNPADICMGHFDINGFKMNKFKVSDGGLNPKIFKNFKIVFSGHFHIRGKQKVQGTDIIYIGSPFHLDRSDINEEKGFCILDLKTFSYEFINNENSLKYVSIEYPNEITRSLINNNIIDVIVKYDESYNEEKYRNYLSKIQKYNPIDINRKLVSNFLSGEEIQDIDNYQQMDISSLMDNYIRKLELKDKENISNIIHSLYEQVKEANK